MRSQIALLVMALTYLEASPLINLMKIAIKNITENPQHLLEQSSDGNSDTRECAEAFNEIMSNDKYFESQLKIFVTTGMHLNDLGLYDSCLDNTDLNYASVIVQ